uniref:Uncharacterized protein n=1 Tax=Zea mays TaxID=4577 RepID=B6SVK9_MAIZE|nr:hypothetical protein [Zea mays]
MRNIRVFRKRRRWRSDASLIGRSIEDFNRRLSSFLQILSRVDYGTIINHMMRKTTQVDPRIMQRLDISARRCHQSDEPEDG